MPSSADGDAALQAPQLNLPEVIAEVRAVFLAYEAALLSNDVQTLNELFWESASTVRYGVAEHNYGIAAIQAYRRQATPVSPLRRLQRTIITTCGRDSAWVSTEFTAPNSALTGRQTQAWVRLAAGWKIIAAHVSEIPSAALKR